MKLIDFAKQFCYRFGTTYRIEVFNYKTKKVIWHGAVEAKYNASLDAFEVSYDCFIVGGKKYETIPSAEMPYYFNLEIEDCTLENTGLFAFIRARLNGDEL